MNEPKEILDNIVYREKELVYLVPCIDVVLYWTGSVLDQSEGVIRFYQEALKPIRDAFTYYRTESMTQARPVKEDTLDLLPFWLQGTESQRDIYMLYLESGTQADEASDRAFAFNATPQSGYARAILPASFVHHSVDSYLQLALTLAQSCPFDFGSAGYAINWNHLGKNKRRVLQRLYALANRYPGLDISHPFCTEYVAGKGIKRVNWLTCLGSAYLQQLGGLEQLKNQLNEACPTHDAHGGGVVIQAGEAPVIGDVNRQRGATAYEAVGRILAPIRSQEHPAIFGPQGLPDREATEQWLSRFDS